MGNCTKYIPRLDALSDTDVEGICAEMQGLIGNDTNRRTRAWARRVARACVLLVRQRQRASSNSKQE